MREIKFRIWSESEQRYVNGLTRYLFGSDDDEKCTLCIPQDFKAIFEQYTGLKDKNGKEIYEGDIVRIDSMDELRVGYVDLVNDQYCIVCGEDDEGYKIVAEFYYYSKPEENCEVIGNMHKNPELLKKEK